MGTHLELLDLGYKQAVSNSGVDIRKPRSHSQDTKKPDLAVRLFALRTS